MNILVNAIDALEEYGETRLKDHPQERQIQTEQPQKDQSQKRYIGQITVRTKLTSSEKVEIAIADNGPGIPNDIKAQIFDPFFTTKPVGKGTGMGMSISYKIITEKHGGTLDCLSEPGQGTEFVIHIPQHQAPIMD